MASKHKEASSFLRNRFFENLKSFSDFEERTKTLANTVEVGNAFEILVEAYLYLDKVMNAKNVWLVGDIPLKIRKELNLPADTTGIDGIYEDTSGKLIPYQVKYRTDMDTLSFGEVSTFLGLTEESLQDRVIFTNARNLSDKIIVRKGIRSVRAAQFHALTEEKFKEIHAWLTDKKPKAKLWDPKPHQAEAVDKITAELKDANRTTAVMACGTGKTLVALWAAEAQEPKTVLVLVPSLALLSQTLPDWCNQTKWGDRFRYLCVCSDASVDQSAKNDEYALRQSDLEFSVTTDASRVRSFLSENQSGVNVIFSTYQSAEVVAEGSKGRTIDFGIFDEAHKTTGPKDGLFAFGLNDKNISIKKRLFLTATPRHYNINKRDKDGNFQTVSMDDETVYGKVAYRLSFSAAVKAEIIVPYKVIISVSLNKEVDDELLRRGSTLVRRNQIQARWVANQIALKRAIQKTSASKIITFHSRVDLAKDFAGDGAEGFSEHVKGFEIFHVNGKQNAADRKALLDGFKTSARGLITNARCLTEGVDVPAVDMVAFVDPRKSKIDIAQAAGRAMRQSKATNKKLGYIVVPLFIEQKKGETESEALIRSGFDEVAEVLAAMLENDDDLVDEIRELQEARGRGDEFNPKKLHEKIKVIGPAIDLEELTNSIDVKILDRLGLSWDRWYGLLQKFYEREGHCRVAVDLIVNGFKLGSWARTQRKNKYQLTENRIKQLDSLGFSWDPRAEQWDEAFAVLVKFHKREGHCRISQNLVIDNFSLGVWVGKQRQNRNQLTHDQTTRLDSLGFSWDPLTEKWEESFVELQKFHRREGHCRVSQNLVINNLSLGAWVSNQRLNKNRLTPERIKRLDSLGFSWDPLTEKWEESFVELQKFHRREGHCRVSLNYQIKNIKLGLWVNKQRQNKEHLTLDQLSRLDALEFSWDPLTEKWEESFVELQKFHRREGHCRVSRSLVVDGINLGSWVDTQRQNKDKLTHDQISRLNSIGFNWDPHTEQWEKGFSALSKFFKLKGHCRVVRSFVKDGFRLGAWINHQRLNKNKLTPDRIKRLKDIGFSWDPRAEQWDEAFAALVKFHKREGHCRVAFNVVISGFKLGIWVGTQRQNKNQLTRDQISRLDSLGFNWDPRTEQWEEAFELLKKFHKREGHCRVAANLVVGDFKLGNWVLAQRHKKDKLTTDRISRLNSLGFSWDPFYEQWEEAFELLKKFHKREGHCTITKSSIIDGVKLGAWVSKQRQKKVRNLLPIELVKKLDSLGFIWRV